MTKLMVWFSIFVAGIVAWYAIWVAMVNVSYRFKYEPKVRETVVEVLKERGLIDVGY